MAWPTEAMIAFYRRFLPWAEQRIAEEVSADFVSLRGVPGAVAESRLKVLDRIGPAQAKRYMIERVRSSVSRILPDLKSDGDAEFLETILLEMVQEAANMRAKRRSGFDSQRFRSLLPGALKESGHNSLERARNAISSKWTSGVIEVETQVVLGKQNSYSHTVTRAGELLCIQASLATWLGLDAVTTYEPSAEHRPEQILAHLVNHWRVFLTAVPDLVGESL